jgi:sterol desaturase/sphingolipid hydroxylase (fatty acid hydroxylase superfamily)
LLAWESTIRLAAFLTVLVAMGVWEAAAPRRKLLASKPARWLSNAGLVVLNTIAIRLVFALGAVGIAVEVQSQKWGLFNQLAWPAWLEIALAAIALDFAIYLQHVMFHAVPLFWRLHLVHHADPDFDVSTGLRFHTLEIVLSMGIKAAAIVLLGAAPLAVLLFEVLLNATSMFSHSNVRMPGWLDAILRLVVVTPDMHRVHHSQIRRETNSNYGFNLPWWDYLLGTYRSQPRQGHEDMQIGLAQISAERAVGLHWLLALPVVARASEDDEQEVDPTGEGKGDERRRQ